MIKTTERQDVHRSQSTRYTVKKPSRTNAKDNDIDHDKADLPVQVGAPEAVGHGAPSEVASHVRDASPESRHSDTHATAAELPTSALAENVTVPSVGADGALEQVLTKRTINHNNQKCINMYMTYINSPFRATARHHEIATRQQQQL